MRWYAGLSWTFFEQLPNPSRSLTPSMLSPKMISAPKPLQDGDKKRVRCVRLKQDDEVSERFLNHDS
jgi:hypothetical protein